MIYDVPESNPTREGSVNLFELLGNILRFRDERDWKQFHTPKNLAVALSIEVSELQELMLWKSDADVARFIQSLKGKRRMEEEIGDVLIYLLLLCHEVHIDPIHAAEHKLIKNAKKYPIELARGSAAKYTDLPIGTRTLAACDDRENESGDAGSRQQSLFPSDPPAVH